MPKYNYECLDCLAKLEEKFKDESSDFVIPIHILEEEVMYETSHSMIPSDEEKSEACVCPRCGSKDHRRIFHGYNVIGYIKGYGYLDKAGCHRDMNKYKLANDDPYKQYRQDGEVDYLKEKLDKGGKHNPKTQYFTPTKNNNTKDE